MNEELEALTKIDHTICINSNENNIKWGVDDICHIDCVNFDEYGKCFSVVFEALKRNEPMKAIFTRITDVLTENFWDEPTCPKCKSLVIDEDKFCRECGQKLDWNIKYD